MKHFPKSVMEILDTWSNPYIFIHFRCTNFGARIAEDEDQDYNKLTEVLRNAGKPGSLNSRSSRARPFFTINNVFSFLSSALLFTVHFFFRFSLNTVFAEAILISVASVLHSLHWSHSTAYVSDRLFHFFRSRTMKREHSSLLIRNWRLTFMKGYINHLRHDHFILFVRYFCFLAQTKVPFFTDYDDSPNEVIRQLFRPDSLTSSFFFRCQIALLVKFFLCLF